MIYYISDLHLFHNNIIRLCNRPFNDVQEMNETIINNWKKTIAPEDTVYILGDVAMYNGEAVREIIKDLPGKKHLVTGNHDVKNIQSGYYKGLFHSMGPYLEIKDEGRKVCLFHYPIEEWDGYYRGFYHLYGHVHDKDKELKRIPGRYNVSADVVGYTPRTLDELIEMNKEVIRG